MLRISLRDNKIGNAKAKYVFHSENDGVLTYEELIKKMASYNTTITEADTSAVMNVFKDVVTEYVCDGKSVQTPLGIFYAVASGTTDNPDTSFDVSSAENDHILRVRYKASRKITRSVIEDIRTERTTGRLKMIPYIQSVANIDTSKGQTASSGEMIRLRGDYLKFDETDKTQGVFLVNSAGETRLDYCTWNKDKRIDALIPRGIASGEYKVKITAKPNTVLYSETFAKPLTIS